MKKQEITKLIQSNMNAHIPAQAPTIDWAKVDVLRQEESIIQPMRMSFSPLRLSLGFALLFVLSLGLFALLYNPVEPEIPLGEALFYEQKDIMSVSFVSTASLIPAFDQQLSASGFRLLAVDLSPIDRVKPYLGMIENLLSQDQGMSSTITPSDLEDYETKLVITTYDLLGNSITHTFYYNVIEYEKENDEETFTIRGIMMLHGTTYQMIGEKSIEDEESKLNVRGFLDETNYIESIYKTEDDESFYEINRVTNGSLVSTSIIKIEYDDADEISIQIEIDSITEISSYEFKYELDEDSPTIKAEFEVNDIENQVTYRAEMKIRVIFDELSGETSYSIFIKDEENEEFEYESSRDIRTDEDDDDEDDDENDDEDDEEDDEDVEDEEDDVENLPDED